jgi:hypothetical protein
VSTSPTHLPSLSTKPYSLLVRTSPAVSLTTSTDDGTLPLTEATTDTPPLTRHLSHSSHHSHSLIYSLSYNHSPSFTNSPTQPILSSSVTAPPTGLTSPHDTPNTHIPSSQAHKGLTIIIVTSIGGTVALLFLALFARRAIVHSRIPRHNAVLTAAERAQLMREIAEYAESASRRQGYSLTAPAPPPYEHAPSYDTLMPH